MSRILSNVITLLLNTVKHGENVHNKRFIFKNLRYTVFNTDMFTTLIGKQNLHSFIFLQEARWNLYTDSYTWTLALKSRSSHIC